LGISNPPPKKKQGTQKFKNTSFSFGDGTYRDLNDQERGILNTQALLGRWERKEVEMYSRGHIVWEQMYGDLTYQVYHIVPLSNPSFKKP
jgi:hypothetical protein